MEGQLNVTIGTSLGPVPKTSSKRKHDSGRRMDGSSEAFVPKSKKGRSGKPKGKSRANRKDAIPALRTLRHSTGNASGSLAGTSPSLQSL